MLPDLKIDVDSKAVMTDFKLKPVQIRKASRMTVNALTRKLNKDLGTAIPKHHGLSIMGFKRVRMKRKASIVRRPAGNVWIGENRVQAKYAGRLREVTGGAMAGRYYFKDAFIATMKTGYKSIFKRKPGSKALVEQRVTLYDAEKIVDDHVTRMKPTINPLLKQNLEREFLRINARVK